MADKSGLKNEQFLKELQEKGSTALKSRNPFGVNVFSGSVTNDGVISGKVAKSKYDTQEILKSVDTNIFELLPPEVPPELDVVPRPIYNEALARISELEIDVERLNQEISDLTGLVSDLRITTQSLRIDLDGRDLLVASVENQNQQSLQQTQASIVDLQNSIQRATSEAIERTSIEAINVSLLEQIDALNSQISGLNNQITNLTNQLISTQEQLSDTQNELAIQQDIADKQQKQGAFSNNEITIVPTPQTDPSYPVITWRGRPTFNADFNSPDTQWINGERLEIENPTDKAVSVTVSQTGFGGKRPFNSIPPFNLIPGGSTTITLTINGSQRDAIKDDISPNRLSRSAFTNGQLIFNSASGQVSIPAQIQIQRGGNYTPR